MLQYVESEEQAAMGKEPPIYHERIIQDPNIMVGKPVVKGTRIPVELVLGHLAHNLDLDELFAAYPHLTIEDVQACLAYAQRAVEHQRKRAARRATAGAAPAQV